MWERTPTQYDIPVVSPTQPRLEIVDEEWIRRSLCEGKTAEIEAKATELRMKAIERFERHQRLPWVRFSNWVARVLRRLK